MIESWIRLPPAIRAGILAMVVRRELDWPVSWDRVARNENLDLRWKKRGLVFALLEVRGLSFSGLAALFALGVALAATEALAQATAVSVSGTSYTQNFDGITTGSNTTAVTQNAGTVGTGVVSGASSGGAYLWVSGTLATGTDKSIGFLSTGSYPGTTSAAPGQSLAILFGFTNTTGATITNLDLAWKYERYRQGSRTQIWEFYTSTDGSTWSANTLGNSLQYTGSSTLVVYNPPESAAMAVNIPSLSISNGSSYYLRWSYMTTGSWSNTQGLGIDDFTMNFTTSGGGSTDVYWGGAAGWTATAPGAGGTGTWADGSGAWDASKKANFGGTAGTVTAAIVTASNGLTFTTTGYTLTGGTLAPGNSIASLATGAATFAAGATFGYEVDSTNLLSLGSAADLLVVSGDLNLDPGNGTILALTDLAGSPNAFVSNTTIFALINYSGTWNGGLFTYGGTPLADGGTFTVGSQQWLIDYNRPSAAGIDNFTGDYLPASSFVTITAVPEPSTYCMALAGLACGGYSMWRRRKKS